MKKLLYGVVFFVVSDVLVFGMQTLSWFLNRDLHEDLYNDSQE